MISEERRTQEDLAIRHSMRFREVSTLYPRRVTEAYEGDLRAAAADSDDQVAAKVRAWEIANGIEPHDWLGRAGP